MCCLWLGWIICWTTKFLCRQSMYIWIITIEKKAHDPEDVFIASHYYAILEYAKWKNRCHWYWSFWICWKLISQGSCHVQSVCIFLQFQHRGKPELVWAFSVVWIRVCRLCMDWRNVRQLALRQLAKLRQMRGIEWRQEWNYQRNVRSENLSQDLPLCCSDH